MGVLAYELLTGHPPFENESRSQTYDNIMYTNPSFSNLPVELSSEAKSFVKMALSKVGAAGCREQRSSEISKNATKILRNL